MAVTYGKGKLGRVYERLRKRSYRKMERSRKMVMFYLEDYDPVTGEPQFDEDLYLSIDHEAYVAGVKDALSEIERLRQQNGVLVNL